MDQIRRAHNLAQINEYWRKRVNQELSDATYKAAQEAGGIFWVFYLCPVHNCNIQDTHSHYVCPDCGKYDGENLANCKKCHEWVLLTRQEDEIKLSRIINRRRRMWFAILFLTTILVNIRM
jgi:hypothetical protein